MTSVAADRRWSFWPLVPLYPYGQRQTLRRELVPGEVWSFEQIQGVFYVCVPIRMTVVRLGDGGLLVYAPVAPTEECIRLLRELEQQYGPVRFIILPTSSGLEHKVFVGPFARRCPGATIYHAPDQWSFPLNLPLSWLGLPGDRTRPLPAEPSSAPFFEDCDYAQLGPIDLGPGVFEEVALFHRRSRSLLVTDSLVSIPEEPPAVTQLDPYPLLYHARETAQEAIADSPEARRKGWWRTALFSFYFRPAALETPSLGETLAAARQAPDRSRRALFGLYPFRWQDTWVESFQRLSRQGELLVAPILQQLILNRDPERTLQWVEQVCQWQFERIIPCHLEAPIAARPAELSRAFALFRDPDQQVLPAPDLELLRSINRSLSQRRITPPAQVQL